MVTGQAWCSPEWWWKMNEKYEKIIIREKQSSYSKENLSQMPIYSPYNLNGL
jgi:hypothetical protein